MSRILEQGRSFFDACESGKGWDVCKAYCVADATFSAQAPALSEITMLKDYCAWTRDLLTPIPDGHYELKFLAADEGSHSVAAIAVFRGTHTGPGGPVQPTGKSVAADYVYHMVFDGDLIKHMTKIWNDTISMQQLGWS